MEARCAYELPAENTRLAAPPGMESSEQGASAAASEASGAAGAPQHERSLEIRFGCARFPGWRGELLILLGLVLAACALTWPLVVTLGQASGMRGDYFNNLWNAWWVKHSLAQWHSPFWTDYLYFPEGISLRRHTLSPLNSLSLAALTSVLDQHQGFNLLLLAHFALSAWCFSLLARAVTGSTAGGVLGGLVYSFCPFHYFYLCQINVFSFEFLPLGLLFFLKHARDGGGRNLAGVVLSALGMALTLEYYVVYCYLAVAVLVPCAHGWARAVPWRTLLGRLALSGGLAAVCVAAVAFPLLWAALTEGNIEAQTSANVIEKNRFNDLLGFFWIGGDEECTVSWPTMLGYSTLLLILAGWRRVLGHWPWLVLGAVFLLLSLGEELAVGRAKTGIPLPYALLKKLPVLGMLRKSDRCFMLVQLVACVALAAAWASLSARLGPASVRAGAWSACAALLMVELTAVPFGRFSMPTSPELIALRADSDVKAVMELPPAPVHVMNGRFDYFQTLHEKKTTLGYTTSIALQPSHDQRLLALNNLYLEYLYERNRELPRFAAQLGVDRVVHYKTYSDQRARDASIDGATLWAPFFRWRKPLIYVRQVGEYIEKPFREDQWTHIRLLLTRALGKPLFEDESVAVFAVPRRS